MLKESGDAGMTPELKAAYLNLDRAMGQFCELLVGISPEAQAALEKVDSASEYLQQVIWKELKDEP